MRVRPVTAGGVPRGPKTSSVCWAGREEGGVSGLDPRCILCTPSARLADAAPGAIGEAYGARPIGCDQCLRGPCEARRARGSVRPTPYGLPPNRAHRRTRRAWGRAEARRSERWACFDPEATPTVKIARFPLWPPHRGVVLHLVAQPTGATSCCGTARSASQAESGGQVWLRPRAGRSWDRPAAVGTRRLATDSRTHPGSGCRHSQMNDLVRACLQPAGHQRHRQPPCGGDRGRA